MALQRIRAIDRFWPHRGLTLSLVRRDLEARYRGSFGGGLWTLLNPLLLMLTYYFVFGVVLESRFPGDPTREGFVLYFLAGMLPWLAISEALGRSPALILEHGNLIKKLVFPSEVLPVVRTLAALVSEAVAIVLFLVFLIALQRPIPLSALWLPALLIPQILMTTGLSFALAATGAFLRDLAQVMGFLLTLWFFLTPICYPESALPVALKPILGNNPLYWLVRGYRAVLLEGSAPDWRHLLLLWSTSLVLFIAGKRWFHKLKPGFADVI
jgi:lipopolysaccharide transport system permease protein